MLGSAAPIAVRHLVVDLTYIYQFHANVNDYSYSNFPGGYSSTQNFLFCGDHNFTVTDIEVFGKQ